MDEQKNLELLDSWEVKRVDERRVKNFRDAWKPYVKKGVKTKREICFEHVDVRKILGKLKNGEFSANC